MALENESKVNIKKSKTPGCKYFQTESRLECTVHFPNVNRELLLFTHLLKCVFRSCVSRTTLLGAAEESQLFICLICPYAQIEKKRDEEEQNVITGT